MPIRQTTGTGAEFVWRHGDQHGCGHTMQGPLGHEGTVSLIVSDGQTQCSASDSGSRGPSDRPDASAVFVCRAGG